MSRKSHPLLNLFKILHFSGLIMVTIGIVFLLATDIGHTVSGMVVISSLIGIGGVLVSPFPVALFIQWACNPQSSKEGGQ